jgi:hypothetical protein
LVDSEGDFSDILVVRAEFRAGLQGGYTEGSTFGLRPNDILRKRQMSDAAARIGGRDGLMNDS